MAIGAGRLAMLLGVVLALGGCAATRLTSTWADPQDSGTPLAKVAVLVFHGDDNLRRFAEDQASRMFQGPARVVPGHQIFDRPDPQVEKVKDRLNAEGFDGVLMARTVSVDTTRQYIPPRTVAVPTGPILVGPYFGPHGFDGYYRHVWGYAYQTMPGYETEQTTIVVESVLYRLPEGKPIWSAVSETRNPDSPAEVVHDLATLIGRELNERGLVRR
jgi:hypothetical protein